MRKFLTNSSSPSKNYSNQIGKQYQLNQSSVFIENVIAEGGFSVVFLARSALDRRKYALKRILVNDDNELNRFIFEIDIIKNLSQKSKLIVEFADSSVRQQQSSGVYEVLILTKYYERGSLLQLMNDRLAASTNAHFAENCVLKMFSDVCLALNELHQLDIIHRDIKIENVLIDSDRSSFDSYQTNDYDPLLRYNYVICDFGSATKSQSTTTKNNIQSLNDDIEKNTTLAYRSPELVDLYSNKPISTKLDIWALGCLLYKICYFEMPFGENPLSILEGRFFLPEFKCNLYSTEMNKLINFMLQIDSNQRPDIYQVAYLAFSLCKRDLPIKNRNNSKIVSFSSINTPITESEWNRSKLRMLPKSTTAENLAVNRRLGGGDQSSKLPIQIIPRERPKSNLNLNKIAISNDNNNNSQFIDDKANTRSDDGDSLKAIKEKQKQFNQEAAIENKTNQSFNSDPLSKSKDPENLIDLNSGDMLSHIPNGFHKTHKRSVSQFVSTQNLNFQSLIPNQVNANQQINKSQTNLNLSQINNTVTMRPPPVMQSNPYGFTNQHGTYLQPPSYGQFMRPPMMAPPIISNSNLMAFNQLYRPQHHMKSASASGIVLNDQYRLNTIPYDLSNRLSSPNPTSASSSMSFNKQTSNNEEKDLISF